MTNYEHMTKEEKELAVKYGFHEVGGEIKVCTNFCTLECPHIDKCTSCHVSDKEMFRWLESEYIPPKTENEQFCETLEVGEVIAVSDIHDTVIGKCSYFKFIEYNAETDNIITDGKLSPNLSWKYGRKLTPEERQEHYFGRTGT